MNPADGMRAKNKAAAKATGTGGGWNTAATQPCRGSSTGPHPTGKAPKPRTPPPSVPGSGGSTMKAPAQTVMRKDEPATGKLNRPPTAIGKNSGPSGQESQKTPNTDAKGGSKRPGGPISAKTVSEPKRTQKLPSAGLSKLAQMAASYESEHQTKKEQMAGFPTQTGKPKAGPKVGSQKGGRRGR